MKTLRAFLSIRNDIVDCALTTRKCDCTDQEFNESPTNIQNDRRLSSYLAPNRDLWYRRTMLRSRHARKRNALSVSGVCIAALLLLLAHSGNGQTVIEDTRAELNAVLDTTGEGEEGTHFVPFFPSTENRNGWRGMLVITNHGASNGTVSISAIDDVGEGFGPVTLTIKEDETKYISAEDLEDGNSAKELDGSTGSPGRGDWRLEIWSELRLEVNSFVSTSSGFTIPMIAVAPVDPVAAKKYRVVSFGDGGAQDVLSALRIVNSNAESATVIIEATDDAGVRGGRVTAEIPGGNSMFFSLDELELGNSAFDGALGEGNGNWRLDVWSDRPLEVISLSYTNDGRLANVSSARGVAGGPNLPAPPEISLISETSLEVSWIDTFDPIFASYSVQGKYRDDSEFGLINGCVQFRVSATSNTIHRLVARVELDDPLIERQVLQVRYKYRNDSFCSVDERSPREWSHTGEAMIFQGLDTPSQSSDLTITAIKADNLSPEPNESITLSVTVANIGSATAPSTSIRYFRSTNATITTRDSEIGNDTVNSLAANENSNESFSFAAPSQPGVYYFGACVDTVTGETDVSNNCSSGLRVEIVDPNQSASPDLVIDSVTLSDVSLTVSQSFNISATVRNQGDVTSPSTTLRYFRSDNSTITTRDTEIGTDSVGSLGPGSVSTETIVLSAPSSDGTYYYGVCVDSVNGEASTTNNCSSGVRVEVSEDDSGGGGDTTYNEGDTITTLPTGFWVPDALRNGVTYQYSGGVVLLEFSNGGVLEHGDYSYVCRNSDGCTVRNRVVEKGTIDESPRN